MRVAAVDGGGAYTLLDRSGVAAFPRAHTQFDARAATTVLCVQPKRDATCGRWKLHPPAASSLFAATAEPALRAAAPARGVAHETYDAHAPAPVPAHPAAWQSSNPTCVHLILCRSAASEALSFEVSGELWCAAPGAPSARTARSHAAPPALPHTAGAARTSRSGCTRTFRVIFTTACREAVRVSGAGDVVHVRLPDVTHEGDEAFPPGRWVHIHIPNAALLVACVVGVGRPAQREDVVKLLLSGVAVTSPCLLRAAAVATPHHAVTTKALARQPGGVLELPRCIGFDATAQVCVVTCDNNDLAPPSQPMPPAGRARPAAVPHRALAQPRGNHVLSSAAAVDVTDVVEVDAFALDARGQQACLWDADTAPPVPRTSRIPHTSRRLHTPTTWSSNIPPRVRDEDGVAPAARSRLPMHRSRIAQRPHAAQADEYWSDTRPATVEGAPSSNAHEYSTSGEWMQETQEATRVWGDAHVDASAAASTLSVADAPASAAACEATLASIHVHTEAEATNPWDTAPVVGAKHSALANMFALLRQTAAVADAAADAAARSGRRRKSKARASTPIEPPATLQQGDGGGEVVCDDHAAPSSEVTVTLHDTSAAAAAAAIVQPDDALAACMNISVISYEDAARGGVHDGRAVDAAALSWICDDAKCVAEEAGGARAATPPPCPPCADASSASTAHNSCSSSVVRSMEDASTQTVERAPRGAAVEDNPAAGGSGGGSASPSRPQRAHTGALLSSTFATTKAWTGHAVAAGGAATSSSAESCTVLSERARRDRMAVAAPAARSHNPPFTHLDVNAYVQARLPYGGQRSDAAPVHAVKCEPAASAPASAWFVTSLAKQAAVGATITQIAALLGS